MLSDTPYVVRRGLAAPSQEPHPSSRPFRLQASALRVLLLTPKFIVHNSHLKDDKNISAKEPPNFAIKYF